MYPRGFQWGWAESQADPGETIGEKQKSEVQNCAYENLVSVHGVGGHAEGITHGIQWAQKRRWGLLDMGWSSDDVSSGKDSHPW
jgi:hypothetical protein